MKEMDLENENSEEDVNEKYQKTKRSISRSRSRGFKREISVND